MMIKVDILTCWPFGPFSACLLDKDMLFSVHWRKAQSFGWLKISYLKFHRQSIYYIKHHSKTSPHNIAIKTIVGNGYSKSNVQSLLNQKTDAPKTMSPQNKYDEKGIWVQQVVQRRCMHGDSHAGDGPGTYSVGRPFWLLGFSYYTAGNLHNDVILETIAKLIRAPTTRPQLW